MKFELTVVDRQGRLVRRMIEATSARDAIAVCASGEQPLSCERRVEAALGGAGRRKELLDFCEALDQILSAGVTLSQALKALASDRGSRGAVIAAAILRELDTGRAPSDAFEATGLGWTPFLIALIRSAERSGQLASAFERFILFERSLLEMRSKLISASIYPVILLVVSALVLLFLLGFVVPKFAMALDDLRADLPAASRIILDTGVWIAENGPVLVLPALAMTATLGALAASPSFRRTAWDLFTKLPGIRDLTELSGRAQAMRVSAALLAGGATVPTAFAVARSTSASLIAQQLARASERVERGEPPSRALADSGLAGPVAVQLLTAAERTGGLAACFERIARGDEIRLGRALERLTNAWGPLLLVGVALLVGGVVVALYWPMLQVFESVR